MQSFYDGMTLVGSLVIMAAMVALTYYASRWYAGRLSKSVSGKLIKIVDRVTISPGCSIIVMQAGDKFYLLGTSDKNIQLLCTLDDFDPSILANPDAQTPFSQILNTFLHKTSNSPKDNGADK